MLRQVAKAAAVARDGPGEVDLSALGLHEMAASLPDYVRMVAAGERGFASAFEEMTRVEVAAREVRITNQRIRSSGFPYVKGLADFDWDFQPSVPRAEIEELATLRFVERAENVLFVGSPGVGKTHLAVDWQHLFGRFREGQPRLPELDRRHVAQRRVDPEVVVPVHVVRELGPELARRAERLAVDELGLQYPVGRLVDGVVVGAALGRQRPLNAEGLEHQVDLGVVELAAAVRVEDLDVRDGEGERRERRLDQPGVLPGPGGVADDLPVVEVDEQADVVPRGPDAHVGQVAAYMGARRPAAEAARDDVGHVGLVDRPGVHLEPLPAVCADQAVLPHDAADPAPADGDARPLERRLYLARAVPALAGGVGRDHGRRGGVRRGGPVGPRAHGVVRRPRDAEEPALR